MFAAHFCTLLEIAVKQLVSIVVIIVVGVIVAVGITLVELENE